MKWVPGAQPVELVLNGRYDGIYLLSETLKINPDRLDIFEQPDMNNDPTTVDGGWLVEIDNYDDENQIVIQERPGQNLRVTHHSPKELSALQRSWLLSEFSSMNYAIYSGDDTGAQWAHYIDATSAARYFLVSELFHNHDAYNGSFYLYKDNDPDGKWHFGPLWDASFGKHKTDWIMNDHPAGAEVHWIEPMFATDTFSIACKEVWTDMLPHLQELYDYGRSVSLEISEAMKSNNLR